VTCMILNTALRRKRAHFFRKHFAPSSIQIAKGVVVGGGGGVGGGVFVINNVDNKDYHSCNLFLFG